MTIQEYHKKMKDFFDIAEPGEYLDPLELMKKKIKIDIVKFDDWLHDRVGEYESGERLNMKDALTLHYGAEASQFIGLLL
jgi:hypothetical protein